MGNSICKRFIHCNDHELGASSDLNAPDKNVMHAQNVKLNGKYLSEGAAREWSTVVFVIVIFISWLLFW